MPEKCQSGMNKFSSQMKERKKTLVVSLGNYLQGIVKPLEWLSVEAIVELNLTIGVPLVQELDKN